MFTSAGFLTSMRALGFAGLVSAGLGGVIYFYLFPQLFVGVVGPKVFIGFCGLLGAGLQQTLSGFFRNFLTPAAKYIFYYEQLFELSMLRRRRIISEEKYEHLVDELTDQRFLGIPPSEASRQLSSRS